MTENYLDELRDSKPDPDWEAIESLETEVKELREEVDGSYSLTEKQGNLLTGVVNAIRGKPSELTLWSHHDASELTTMMVERLNTAINILKEYQVDLCKIQTPSRTELSRLYDINTFLDMVKRIPE